MRIAVVGAGALGLYYGALLQRGGEDVHFLLRRDYDAIAAKGLIVHSINGDFHLPLVQGYHSPAEIGPVDLVLVGLKSFANDRLRDLVAPLIGERTQILTLQNGLGNEELLASLFGPERIIGGVAFLCSNRGEPGVIHHLGAGRVIIGEYERRDAGRLERVAAAFRTGGIDCKAVGDLRKARWEKLVWNIPFNGLSALLLQPVDLLLGMPATRDLVRSLMLEVIEGANSQDLTEAIPNSYAEAMLSFTDAMGTYMPSMQIDRQEGRMLETAAIFRKPLEYAKARGVAMPRVEMLATLLEQAVGTP